LILLGQAGGRACLSVERVAINVDDARIADNAGMQPVDEPVAANGPAAYFASVPVKAMAAAVREAGIPAEVSNSAGTFVCNHLLYGVLHYLAASGREARAGFIHVPWLDALPTVASGGVVNAASFHPMLSRGAVATVFGADADEFFHAWSVARFVGQVAAAGKAEYPLPLYANAALRDPIDKPPAGSYESGGPTDNVLDIWKAAAPAIDILAPDIYMSDGARYRKVLELYRRPDNALLVPENGSSPEYAKYFFAALGQQAIGWAPFGVDYTAYAQSPIGKPRHNEETLAPFALNYRLAAPIARELARLSFDGKLHAVVEEKEEHTQTIDLGRWKAIVTYGVPAFGFGRDPRGNPEPTGRALVGDLGEDRFLVAGYFCRVDFQPSDTASGAQREYVRVEEGGYEDGVFRPIRIWNGDETDWGLNFSSAPQVLQVSLGTY